MIIEQTTFPFVFVASSIADAEENWQFQEENAHVEAKGEQNSFHLLVYHLMYA